MRDERDRARRRHGEEVSHLVLEKTRRQSPGPSERRCKRRRRHAPLVETFGVVEIDGIHVDTYYVNPSRSDQETHECGGAQCLSVGGPRSYLHRLT